MFENLNAFFIREHVGALQMPDTYDILNPETQEQIGIAKEQPGRFALFLRMMLFNKNSLPTTINVYDGQDLNSGRLIFSIKRGSYFFRPRIDILAANGRTIGQLKEISPINFENGELTICTTLQIRNAKGEEVALLKANDSVSKKPSSKKSERSSDRHGRDWTFMLGDEEIGTVSKEYEGMKREHFTSADRYLITINGETAESKTILLLAAGLAVDILFNEHCRLR